MPVNAVLVSDLHYHLHHAFSKDGGRSRLKDISDVMQQISDYCNKNTIENIFILGDVFEKRGIIDSLVYNAFATDLKRFLQRPNTTVYILVGNHDQDLITNSSWDNSLTPLANLHSNLVIISEPQVIKLYGLFSILCIPYIADHKEVEILINKNPSDYVFAHVGISGAKLINTDYQVKDGVDLGKLRQVPIFTGHYHTPQTMGNATYIGSPIHHSFNDAGQEKCFIELNFATGSFKRILTQYPKFIRQYINDPNDIYKINSNDYYQLYIKEKILLNKDYDYLNTHTKGYEIIFTLKEDTQAIVAKFDSELRVLRKFIEKEFKEDKVQLYKEARKLLC